MLGMLKHKKEWIAVLFGCGLLGFSISQNLSPKPDANPAEEFGFGANAAFFKLDISLKYKGEPVRISPVVGCSVAVERVPGGGTTKWAGFGMNPNLYMVAMKSGGAIAVVPPAFCKVETTSGGSVPGDFLPAMMVFDDANQIDFGIAYLNSDAYEAPGAAMTDIKATVEKATVEDFVEFKRSGPPNMISKEDFKQRYSNEEFYGKQYVGRGLHPMSCAAYGRFEMPERMRASARQSWPDSKPHYWFITKFSDEIDIVGKNNENLVVKDTYGNPKPYKWIFGAQTNANGLPTRSGHSKFSPGSATPAEIYPSYLGYQWRDFNRLPVNDQNEIIHGKEPIFGMMIDKRPERRGMAYCQTGIALPISENDNRRKLISIRMTQRFVGSEPVWSPPSNSPAASTIYGGPRFMFEEDTHFWESINFHVRYPNGSN